MHTLGDAIKNMATKMKKKDRHLVAMKSQIDPDETLQEKEYHFQIFFLDKDKEKQGNIVLTVSNLKEKSYGLAWRLLNVSDYKSKAKNLAKYEEILVGEAIEKIIEKIEFSSGKKLANLESPYDKEEVLKEDNRKFFLRCYYEDDSKEYVIAEFTDQGNRWHLELSFIEVNEETDKYFQLLIEVKKLLNSKKEMERDGEYSYGTFLAILRQALKNEYKKEVKSLIGPYSPEDKTTSLPVILHLKAFYEDGDCDFIRAIFEKEENGWSSKIEIYANTLQNEENFLKHSIINGIKRRGQQ